MTPREIILANIEHTDPPRPGMNFSGDRMNDFLPAGPRPHHYTQKRWEEGKFEYYDDEWGNIWKRIIGGCVKGEVDQPVIADWSQLDDFTPPDYTHPDCGQLMKEAFDNAGDKFKLACIGGWIFDNARYLRKMDVYFMDMAMYPEQLKRLHEMVAGVYERKIHLAADAGADGVMIGEDMGTQTGLLFSPAMWRDFFGELYTRLFGLAHDHGMKVLMHSCGNNAQIVPDLLEAGVDAFQFDQPTVYDMDWLAELMATHKAALWSPVDIQKIMPTGDRDIIEAGTREMIRIFRGGLICKDYPDLPGIGVKEQWDMWAYNTILDECDITEDATA